MSLVRSRLVATQATTTTTVPSMSTPTEFKCSNCSDATGTIGIVLALAALIAAIGSLYYSHRQKELAEDQTKIARNALAQSSEEHRVFIEELQRRADFDVKLELLPSEWSDGTITAPIGSIGRPRLQIGIKNTGRKRATHVLVNVVAPERLRGNFHWSHEDGTPRDIDKWDQATTPTPEILRDADGRDHRGAYLSHTYDVITRRSHYVTWVSFPMLDAHSVPFRVRVESDDLPDDRPEVVADFMVRVVPPTPP
jgi:hypothetical protein